MKIFVDKSKRSILNYHSKNRYMIESDELIGSLIKLQKSKITTFEDYQVLIGFSGFGNVGFLALTHLVESLDLESIAFWGNSSWYHRGNLESLLTVYKHEPSKTIIVITRLPIHVSTVPQRFWDQLAQDLLLWNARKYIIVGGLRESTRSATSSAWAAFAPSPEWTRKFGDERSFGDNLAMIGPLSSFLVKGTALDLPILGLLAYCNFEEDPEAALFATKEIVKLCGIKLPEPTTLKRFNYSFIPGGQIGSEFATDDGSSDDLDDDDDIPGYDLSDLI